MVPPSFTAKPLFPVSYQRARVVPQISLPFTSRPIVPVRYALKRESKLPLLKSLDAYESQILPFLN